MRRLRSLILIALVASAVAAGSGCQRMADVQTGTRVVDTQGQIVSENVRTVRVSTDQAGKYRVMTVTLESQAASLYAEAQKDIAAGNTDEAAKKLARVLAIQPDHADAKKQLSTIKAGKTVTADKNAPAAKPSPTKPKPSTESTKVAGGLVKWTPDALRGFSAEKAGVDPLSVSRQYTPLAEGKVATLVIVAEQFRTVSAAKAALASQVKSRYPSKDSTQKINGHDTYFGTDGGRFAVIGFTDGAVMVAVEAGTNGSASELKGPLTDVVKQMP